MLFKWTVSILINSSKNYGMIRDDHPGIWLLSARITFHKSVLQTFWIRGVCEEILISESYITVVLSTMFVFIWIALLIKKSGQKSKKIYISEKLEIILEIDPCMEKSGEVLKSKISTFVLLFYLIEFEHLLNQV